MSDDFRYSDARSSRDERQVRRWADDGDDFKDRPRYRRGLSDLLHPSEEEKNSAMLCHLLAIFLHFIGPIIIWTSKKDESKFVDWHGREALNFSINMMIYNIAGGLVITAIAIVTCGFGAILIPLLFLVPIYALIMHIIAMNAAKRGELYRYPLIFRMIGPPEGAESIADQYNLPARTYAAAPRTRSSGDSAGGASAEYPPAPSSSGGGMIWVWIVGAVCLLLLLGCFVAIGAVVLLRTSSSKSPTSKSLSPVVGNSGTRPGNGLPPNNADPVDQALRELKDNDLFARVRAADALGQMNPNHPRRSEVARELAQMLRDPEILPRQAAGRALPIWATRDQTPELIDLLKDPVSNKPRIIARLGEFKDDRAIEPLADALRDLSTRAAAADALKKIGPNAEDHVIPILQDRDVFVRKSACDVLKVIGTQKSVAALEAVAKDRSRPAARAANDALREIRARNR